MKIAILTPQFHLPNELSRLLALLPEVDYVFFRKDISLDEAHQYLSDIPSSWHRKIILNTHHKLSTSFALGGLHLKESLRQERKNLSGYFSSSFHSLDDLLVFRDSFRYLIFGSVFPSISKKGYLPKYSIEEISHFLKSHEIKNVIAIGGITPDKATMLSEMGFAGLALLGSVWG